MDISLILSNTKFEQMCAHLSTCKKRGNRAGNCIKYFDFIQIDNFLDQKKKNR